MHHLLIIKRPRFNKPTRDQWHSLAGTLTLNTPREKNWWDFYFSQIEWRTVTVLPACLSMTTDHHNRRVWMINIYVIPFRPEIDAHMCRSVCKSIWSITCDRSAWPEEILRPSQYLTRHLSLFTHNHQTLSFIAAWTNLFTCPRDVS